MCLILFIELWNYHKVNELFVADINLVTDLLASLMLLAY